MTRQLATSSNAANFESSSEWTKRNAIHDCRMFPQTITLTWFVDVEIPPIYNEPPPIPNTVRRGFNADSTRIASEISRARAPRVTGSLKVTDASESESCETVRAETRRYRLAVRWFACTHTHTWTRTLEREIREELFSSYWLTN